MLNNHKTLSVQNDGERLIIKFPVRTFTFVFSLLVVLALPIIPILLPLDFLGDSLVIGIIYYICVIIFNVYYFIQLFTRKLVINKSERTITYNSFLKRVFNIDEIDKMENKSHFSGEGGTSYSLAVYIHNRRIKIETESNEQSLALKEEISSFINENERR